MTRLSVNINKIATLRNARGGKFPDVLRAAINCQDYGAQGITVHPRPDERHIRYQDVIDIKPFITTEFNIEGYPNRKFLDLVLSILPDQVTLVPDLPDVITSNAGWDTIKHKTFLKEVISEIKKKKYEFLYLSIQIPNTLIMQRIPELTESNFIPNRMQHNIT